MRMYENCCLSREDVARKLKFKMAVETPVSECDFQRALSFSLRQRGNPEFKLKVKQVEAIRAVVREGKDVLAVLPTGYGKSLIYQLLPNMFDCLERNNRGIQSSIVIVVSPLTALMLDQVDKITRCGQTAALLQVVDQGFSVHGDSEENVRGGRVAVLFGHPELFLSSTSVRDMLLSDVYQRNVVSIVADEAHCIVEW